MLGSNERRSHGELKHAPEILAFFLREDRAGSPRRARDGPTLHLIASVPFHVMSCEVRAQGSLQNWQG
jgi:hypothetical protein